MLSLFLMTKTLLYLKEKFAYIITICAVSLMAACAAYKAERQEALLSFPELGAIVKTKGNLWYSASEQVGVPKWGSLRVSVQQLPFNNESYSRYAKAVQRAGQINSIPYIDSLPYKPKYIRLQLLDKIKITELLNNDDNQNVKDYLEKDENLKLVTSLDLALSEAEITFFDQAEAFELRKDEHGSVILNVVVDDNEQAYYLSDLRVFDYGYATFCWGEDRYHRLRIENIAPEGEKCPKGTHAKPKKVSADRSYLKF